MDDEGVAWYGAPGRGLGAASGLIGARPPEDADTESRYLGELAEAMRASLEQDVVSESSPPPWRSHV